MGKSIDAGGAWRPSEAMTASPSQSPLRHRDHGADTLRGIAILMILVLHGIVMAAGVEHYPWWLIEAVNRLNSGVQLFFVLSGYVVIAAMDRAVAYGDGRSGFLLRRAAKLVPLYLIFLHLNIAFYLIWSWIYHDPVFYRNSVTSDNLNWYNYGLHLFFLEGFSPRYINTLLDGGWSIVCEVYFYLLIPFVIHRLSGSLRSAIWCLAGSLVLALVSTFTLGRYTGVFGYYALPVQLPCFLMGIVVYRVRERFPIELATGEQVAIAAVLVLFLIGLIRIETMPLGGHLVIASLFASALLFLRTAVTTGPLGMLQRIGRQSYALFLAHILLLKIAYSVGSGWEGTLNLWVALAGNLLISVFGSLIVSWLIFDRVDRAGVDAMSRYLSKRRKAA